MFPTLAACPRLLLPPRARAPLPRLPAADPPARSGRPGCTRAEALCFSSHLQTTPPQPRRLRRRRRRPFGCPPLTRCSSIYCPNPPPFNKTPGGPHSTPPAILLATLAYVHHHHARNTAPISLPPPPPPRQIAGPWPLPAPQRPGAKRARGGSSAQPAPAAAAAAGLLLWILSFSALWAPPRLDFLGRHPFLNTLRLAPFASAAAAPGYLPRRARRLGASPLVAPLGLGPCQHLTPRIERTTHHQASTPRFVSSLWPPATSLCRRRQGALLSFALSQASEPHTGTSHILNAPSIKHLALRSLAMLPISHCPFLRR